MQPCGVTHGQMQHQEPAFHEELDLLMSRESGSGISHTGDGWTQASAPYQGTWRHEAEQPDCLWLRQPQLNFLQRALWFLHPAIFSRLGCVSLLAGSSCSCESGPEIITETWLLAEGA